jgi:hypothetical protein
MKALLLSVMFKLSCGRISNLYGHSFALLALVFLLTILLKKIGRE